MAGRKLNGDSVMLNYYLDQTAEESTPGSVLRFESGPLTIRRVTPYRV